MLDNMSACLDDGGEEGYQTHCKYESYLGVLNLKLYPCREAEVYGGIMTKKIPAIPNSVWRTCRTRVMMLLEELWFHTVFSETLVYAFVWTQQSCTLGFCYSLLFNVSEKKKSDWLMFRNHRLHVKYDDTNHPLHWMSRPSPTRGYHNRLLHSSAVPG